MSSVVANPPHTAATTSLAPRRARWRAASELLLVVVILEVGMWEWCGALDGVFRGIALPVVALIVWQSHQRRKLAQSASTDGESTAHARDTAKQAWLQTFAVTFGLAILIPILAIMLRAEGEGFRLFWLEKGNVGIAGYLAGKGAFIVVQQVLLQYFLGPCCAELWPHRQAARCCAAMIFGVVHLPSLLLVSITMIASFCWLSLFARGGRILPLAASHLALAVLAHAALPERHTLNMRVGAPAQQIVERYRVPLRAELASHFQTLCSDRYYAACGGTDDDFLGALYRDALLRSAPAPAADLAAWRSKLRAHVRTDIVVEFFNSQEFADLAQSQRAAALAERIDERLAHASMNHPEDRQRR